MIKIYKNYLMILVLFLSSIALGDTSSKPKSLPSSYFDMVNEPLAISKIGVFYNQLMESRSLDNFDNHFMIIHFWASWCMECNKELLALNELQKDFRKKALLVIAITEDFKDVGQIDKYFTKHNIDYLDIYVDKKNKIYQSLDLNHLPVSYLVDFNGNIIAKSKIATPIDWNDQEIMQFLDEKVSKYQLLPPEFKAKRDKYEAPPALTVKEKPKKSKIFIN